MKTFKPIAWPLISELDDTELEDLYYQVLYTAARTRDVLLKMSVRMKRPIRELMEMALDYAMRVATV